MIEEVILCVADGQDLINIIAALFTTRSYHAFLTGDNYLWRQLLKIHYPHYVVPSTQKLLPTLITLLRSIPNRMQKPDHWGFCLDMEQLSRAYACPMSYSFMREEMGVKCKVVDWRLIKKMFDTECITCDSSPNVRVSKDRWIINNLTNVAHSCQGINSHWVAAFIMFLERTFEAFVSEYYAKHVLMYAWTTKSKGLTREEKQPMEHSISLHVQEVMSRKEYGLYHVTHIVSHQ
jgi:hypothetical protein